ncbi:MAG: ABC transporter permease [Candidatus Cloacimonetes bacterium]|nr:ABC transporter permease [Candidatus Cloacimonadota bacterium]
MFKNYLKMSLRNIRKHKLNSVINIIGLALGLTCSLLILFYLKAEISYEKFFPKADRIYRITNENLDENGMHWAVVSPLHALEIQADIPEIESAIRMFYCYTQIYSYGEGEEVKRFQEDHGFYTDPGIVNMFDIEFLKGNPETALNELNSIVITESFAKRYFGEENPLGKTVQNEQNRREMEVTGVINDLPSNTHLNYEFLVSMPTLYDEMESRGAADWMESRGWAHFYTYVLLNENADLKTAEEKMLTFEEHFYQEWYDDPSDVHENTKLHFQPLKDIHLKSHLEQEMSANSNIVYVYVFAFIVVLVLLLAGVNFVNLSTARAFNRMREVGVRKVVGAARKSLMIQFLTESLILASISALIALLLIELSIPFYQSITGLEFTLFDFLSLNNILLIVSLVIISGTLSGLYPAFFMSGFDVITSLKGQKNPKTTVSYIRNFLVIFQFVISVFMIFSTIIIYQQMNFFQQKNLGFDTDQVVAIEMYGELRREVGGNIDSFKSELLGFSSISSVALSSNLPGERFSVEDIWQESIPEEVEIPPIRYLRVDKDFIETMGIKMVEGKSFADWTSENPAFILNEKALKAIQLQEPIGKIASNFRGTEAEIVGIVQDFNFASLHNTIEPLVLELNPRWGSKILVKIAGDNIPEVIQFLKNKVEEVAPGSIFQYTFLDEKLNTLYANEQRLNSIFKTFSILAIIISCLGLFGLSAYYAEMRTKEIGVRKVMGASISNIVSLLSSKFLIWVFVANLIALPIAWLAMNKWLLNFAYKIEISPSVFLVSFALSVIIAFVTVSFRTLKAAIANPVMALKYE